jgi:hypothetical protein
VRPMPTTPRTTAPKTPPPSPGTPCRVGDMMGVLHRPPACVSMHKCLTEYLGKLTAPQTIRLVDGLSSIQTIGTMCSGTDAPVAVLAVLAKVGGCGGSGWVCGGVSDTMMQSTTADQHPAYIRAHHCPMYAHSLPRQLSTRHYTYARTYVRTICDTVPHLRHPLLLHVV